MAPSLDSLPAEILASIADELDANDYGNLRLCCKQADKFTFHSFALKFFTSRKFFRAHLSLTTLVSISESRFSPYLETVILSTVQFDRYTPGDFADFSRTALFQAHVEQRHILATGWDRDMLTMAFVNLPNLRGLTVDLFDDGDLRISERRWVGTNDGGYGFKTLLGNMDLERHTSIRQVKPTGQSIVTCLTLLAAACKANIRPKVLAFSGLDTKTRPANEEFVGVSDDAFSIPSFMRQSMLPVIQGLEELSLGMQSGYGYSSPGNPSTSGTNRLREFLGYPRKLRKLRIRDVTNPMRSRGKDSLPDDLWAWMGTDDKGKGNAAAEQQGVNGTSSSASNPLESPPPIAFPHLRELEVYNGNMRLPDLIRLLKKVSPTLRKISLHDVHLGRHEQDYHQYILNTNDKVVRIETDLWARFCGQLAALPCECLDEVNISGFSGLGAWHLEEYGGALTQTDGVHYKTLKITGEDKLTAQAKFSYKGPDVRNALSQLAQDLLAAVTTGCPRP